MEFEKLQKIIAEVLNLSEEEIRPDSTFVDDLGADSLDVFQIIMGIEEEFDIEIDNEEAEKITTAESFLPATIVCFLSEDSSSEQKTRRVLCYKICKE